MPNFKYVINAKRLLEETPFIRKDRLKVALSTIEKDEQGNYSSPSEFITIMSNIMLNEHLGIELPHIHPFMQYISQDINNIETITIRLAWERDLWKTKQLNVGKWMAFAQCDIDLFQIEMRSILDYVAKIILRIADNQNEVPDKGFNKLKNWLAKLPENADKLGKDLAELVSSADWFEDLKNVRDANVHHGGMTIVFLEEGRILFQTLDGYKNLVTTTPEIMYNENVVDFELYAGMYFGYLIAFLEEFSAIIKKRLPKLKVDLKRGNPRKLYSELPIIFQWVDKLNNV